MSRFILALAALGALGACNAAALPNEEMGAAAPALAGEPALADDPAPEPLMPAYDVVDVRCDIRARRTANGVELEAFARSSAPAMGEYEFVITKQDAGGASDIVQSGAFDLAGGERQSLGLSEISVERGGRYSARLVLSDEDGVICQEEVRS